MDGGVPCQSVYVSVLFRICDHLCLGHVLEYCLVKQKRFCVILQENKKPVPSPKFLTQSSSNHIGTHLMMVNLFYMHVRRGTRERDAARVRICSGIRHLSAVRSPIYIYIKSLLVFFVLVSVHSTQFYAWTCILCTMFLCLGWFSRGWSVPLLLIHIILYGQK